MPKASSLAALTEALLAGEIRALSRLITRVEAQQEDVIACMGELWEYRNRGSILGVTGPPGAGKSTLVDRLVRHHRCQGQRVAVLAIDPSSPFTGGAILGDRIRMQSHATDSGVFIRSLGTRGHQGGLSRTSLEAALLCLAAGFERVIIETVGVGQSELEIVGVADQVLVLLVPEAGDVVQTLKAGLLEGADLFAVNKADRPGADRLVRELTAISEEAEPGEDRQLAVPVFAVSAKDETGLDELFVCVDERLNAGLRGRRRLSPQAFVARIVGQERGRQARREALAALGAGGEAEALGLALEEGTTNPYAVVQQLLEDLS